MSRLTSLLIAAPVAVGLLAAPAAHAEWRHGGGGWDRGGGDRGGWEHHGGGHRGDRGGSPLAGALLGLGIAAVVGGAIAASQAPSVTYSAPPPAYYAPQPSYSAPPTYYAPAPTYYAPQTSYYAAPAYPPQVVYSGGPYYQR